MARYIIKRYNKFINESKDNNFITIIPKGKELFHGTVEDFDINNINTGAYDDILWTSEDSSIAQTYIPVSGTTLFTKTEFLHRPQYDERSRSVQKQLGFTYDYDKVEFDGNRATSWPIPEVWREESDKAYLWKEKNFKLHKRIKTLSDKYEEFNNKFIKNYKEVEADDREKFRAKSKKMSKELYKLEDEYEKQNKEYNDKGSSTKFEYDYINKALMKLGYKPKYKNNYDNNYDWRLKEINGDDGNSVILPANYRATGRLIIIKTKVDLKIYDLTMGGEIGGDLTDLDYHKIDLFRKVEREGYDGIKINDFAQIESEGNFGHHAIGLFKSTIPKLDITSINAVHPDNFGENHIKTRDFRSKEYKNQ